MIPLPIINFYCFFQSFCSIWQELAMQTSHTISSIQWHHYQFHLEKMNQCVFNDMKKLVDWRIHWRDSFEMQLQIACKCLNPWKYIELNFRNELREMPFCLNTGILLSPLRGREQGTSCVTWKDYEGFLKREHDLPSEANMKKRTQFE